MLRSIKQILRINLLLIFVLVQCKFEGEATNVIPSDSSVLTAIQPLNNSSDQSIIQTFKWNSDNAQSYDVYLDKVNPPVKSVASKTDKQSLVYPFPLDYNTTYYWRVVANYSDGTQKTSSVWTFATSANSNPGSTGYALVLKKFNTLLPNLVNFLFQVVDLDNNGVTNFQTTDFEFFEDGLPLQSESAIEIKKQTELPYKIRTVLMLDNSTSLTGIEIDKIRAAASSFVKKITVNQEVSIYQFSENVEMLSNFTNLQDSLDRAISRYKIGANTTGLYSAVVKGASLWQDNFSINDVLQGSMIVFTDGNETSRPTVQALTEALNAVKNKSVYTIGLRGKDQLDEETLTRIGRAGFYGINDASQLENQFTLIQKKITDYANSFYQLTYKSPRRGIGEYNLIIRVKGNPYTGDSSYILGRYSSAGFSSN
ncbi:hypothetical protein C0389_07840 [bacterium]|nr:hypothetical protein [bacterium]